VFINALWFRAFESIKSCNQLCHAPWLSTCFYENLHRFHVLIPNTDHNWNRGKIRVDKWDIYLGLRSRDVCCQPEFKSIIIYFAQLWYWHRSWMLSIVNELSSTIGSEDSARCYSEFLLLDAVMSLYFDSVK
jgi:hypothetical protein